MTPPRGINRNRNNALLITVEKDLRKFVFPIGQIHATVALLLLAGLSAKMKRSGALTVLANYCHELLSACSVTSPVGIPDSLLGLRN